MKEIYPDLWQTSPERPLTRFPDTTCNAFLLVRTAGNVLFYCTGRESTGATHETADHYQIEALGGVRHVLLGHWHEASPSLQTIKKRFGATIICHARDAPPVEKQGHVAPEVTFWERQILLNDIEALPTPGHRVGSACYLYRSSHGKAYLFTGDTIWPTRNGWNSVTFEDDPKQSSHRSSLDLLASLAPDVVFATIGPGETYRETDAASWTKAIEMTKESLA